MAYQYLLMWMYVISRVSRGTPLQTFGHFVADSGVRTLVRLLTAELGANAPDTTDGHITADACYPYWFFQSRAGVRGISPWDGVTPSPSCPCLYFYGTRKPFNFHSNTWEQHLRRRPDCKVVPVNAGHWVQLQQSNEINRTMDDWLSSILR